MIDGKPFQLSVVRNAAVVTNAVNKLNASNRFGSIRDALVSDSPYPNLHDRVVHLYSQRSE